MTKLLRHDWTDTAAAWSEDDLQMAIVQTLRRRGILFAADQNAGKRSKRDGARRKALGMAAGEPDLRLYLDDGRIVFVEVKTARGRMSGAQIERRKALDALGYETHVLQALTPAEAVDKITTILEVER
jgi:hypothetical protein